MLKVLFITSLLILSVKCAEKAPRITQNDGSRIPSVGLGTYRTGEETYEAVRDAVVAGYRHIDTSLNYGTEKDIGRALKELLKEGKVKRQELYVVSKLEANYHQRDRVAVGVKESLANLGLEYLDLYLVHWPASTVDMIETWTGMEDILKSGLTKSIGVSNFNAAQIDRIIANSTVKPVANQILCNPYFNQKKLLDYLHKKNITAIAYSPLGSSTAEHLLKDPKLVTISNAHNVSSAQIALRYQIQRNVVVIPKSVTKKYIIENIDLFQFELSDQQMLEIDSLDKS